MAPRRRAAARFAPLLLGVAAAIASPRGPARAQDGRDAGSPGGRARAACARNDARACVDAATREFILAASDESGVGSRRDDAQAVAHYRRGCDLGSAESCLNLGARHAAGRGVPRDDARAVALFRLACDAGSAIGCRGVGAAHEHGVAAPRDSANAGTRRTSSSR